MKSEFSINEKPEGLDEPTAAALESEARYRAFLSVFGSAFIDIMMPQAYGGGGVSVGDMRALCRKACKAAFEEIIKDMAKERFKVELNRQFQEMSQDSARIEEAVKAVEARAGDLGRKEYEKDFY